MRLRTLTLVAACACLTACSGPAASAPASDPAPHADPPRVETRGGPTLPIVHLVPVFYSGDPLQSRIEQFLRALGKSSYWTDSTAEYGTAAIKVAQSIVASGPPPAVVDDSEIVRHLNGYFIDGPPGINTAYLVFYPSGTTITDYSTKSCRDFDAYHGESPTSARFDSTDAGPDIPMDASPDGQADEESDGPADAEALLDPSDDASRARFPPHYSYAVFPRCPGPLVDIDALTVAASHEIAELTTDPMPQSWPAFSGPDVDHLVWANAGVGAGEIGDMCNAAEAPDRLDQRLVDGFMVQRLWSNAAAEANRDPCVPPIAAPYFIAVPDLDEQVSIDTASGPLVTTGIQLAVGEVKTVAVRLSSTGPTPDWTVAAVNVSSVPHDPDAGAVAPPFGFSWDRQTGHNGDVLKLTITRLFDSPYGGSAVEIVSVPSVASSVRPTSWNAGYVYIANASPGLY